MSIKLPIVISAEQKVSEYYGLTTGMLEKLEAWANFETLKANWYGDEDKTLNCQFTLVTAQTFKHKFAEINLPDWQVNLETGAALRFGDLCDKQHIIINIEHQPAAQQHVKSRWLKEDIQLYLQAILKQWLNEVARQFNFDSLHD